MTTKRATRKAKKNVSNIILASSCFKFHCKSVKNCGIYSLHILLDRDQPNNQLKNQPNNHWVSARYPFRFHLLGLQWMMTQKHQGINNDLATRIKCGRNKTRYPFNIFIYKTSNSYFSFMTGYCIRKCRQLMGATYNVREAIHRNKTSKVGSLLNMFALQTICRATHFTATELWKVNHHCVCDWS